MNPGMLMVERELNLPNLTHFLVSNRVYGATSNAALPNLKDNDYAAIARGMGSSAFSNSAAPRPWSVTFRCSQRQTRGTHVCRA